MYDRSINKSERTPKINKLSQHGMSLRDCKMVPENMARDLFKKTFAGYRYLDMTPPKWSEYVTGVYVYGRMRRIA